MAEVAGRRMTAEIDGDFVVFLIGARLNNKLRMVRSVLDLGGRRRGMKAMLDYLVERPEKGLLASEMGIPTIVQYWRSFEHLEGFAPHLDRPIHRLTRGRHTMGSLLSGLPVVMLTTTGARSGKPRTVPILGIPVQGGVAVIASNWGQQHHPSWYHNLRAHPEAQV